MEQLQYDLCKPFNISEAEEGKSFILPHVHKINGAVHKLVSAARSSHDEYAISSQLGYEIIPATVLEDVAVMVPLTWLDGKPVYVGSVLWSTICEGFRYDVVSYDSNNGIIASSINETGARCEHTDNLSWEQPKPKPKFVTMHVNPLETLAFLEALGDDRGSRARLVESVAAGKEYTKTIRALDELQAKLAQIDFAIANTVVGKVNGKLRLVDICSVEETKPITMLSEDVALLVNFVGDLSYDNWNYHIELAGADDIFGFTRFNVTYRLYTKLKQAS